MMEFFLRRLLRTVIVLIGVSLLVFVTIRFIPGDPAQLLAGEQATAEMVAQVRTRFGLNHPLWVQYAVFVQHALSGDLGRSTWTGRPVVFEIQRRYVLTLILATAAMTFSLVAGIPLGILAAVRRGTWVDKMSIAIALLGVSAPTFVVAVVLQFYFAVVLGWLPVTRAENWRHLILPAISLGAFPVATIARLLRTSLLETLREAYVHTARAKGLPEVLVVLKHALKPALIPTVTVVGMQFGLMLGASVFAESIFDWPGLSRYLVEAVGRRDYPVIQGAVLALGVTYVFVNASVDIMYSWIDPRIRY